MKSANEKQSDQVMRFFTPELYVRINSKDDEEADRADEEWETVLRKYRRHLRALRPLMPDDVKSIVRLYLHDAEVLSIDSYTQRDSPFHHEFAILPLKQNNVYITLEYLLWDQIRASKPCGDDWPFSKEQQPEWLYDEIDLVPGSLDRFVHRILLSNGEVVELPFTWVRVRRGHMPAPREGSLVHHSV